MVFRSARLFGCLLLTLCSACSSDDGGDKPNPGSTADAGDSGADATAPDDAAADSAVADAAGDTGTGTTCKGVTCGHFGKCVEVGSAATCECDPGFHEEKLHCVLDPCTGSKCPRTVKEWQALYDAEWTKSLPFYTSTSSGPETAGQRRYYDFRVIDPSLTMFQVTGDTKYLDSLIWYVDRVKSEAVKSPTGDGYFDWPVPFKGKPTNFQLYDGHGMRNLFKFLWVLKKYPKVRAQSNFQAKYDEYLAWFTKNLWDKWESRGCTSILRSNSWMSSHMSSNMALYLHLLEDDAAKKAEYWSWVHAWNDDTKGKCNSPSLEPKLGFRQKIRVHAPHGGYVWQGDWNTPTGFGDIGHTNAGVQSVINQYLQGKGAWTAADIAKFTKTLNALLDASPDADYANLPYALDAVYNSTDDNRPFITYGWSMLGRFNPKLNARLNGMSTVQFKSSRYYNDWISIMAYNTAFLAGTLAYPE